MYSPPWAMQPIFSENTRSVIRTKIGRATEAKHYQIVRFENSLLIDVTALVRPLFHF